MQVVRSSELPFVGHAREFAGTGYGVPLSLLLVEAKPGDGPAMHRHDYPEVIVIQEGEATCIVGEQKIVVQPGDVVFIASGEWHSFFNSGKGPLTQIDIHLSEHFATKWLEAMPTAEATP